MDIMAQKNGKMEHLLSPIEGTSIETNIVLRWGSAFRAPTLFLDLPHKNHGLHL
jgi:hypothetical protein